MINKIQPTNEVYVHPDGIGQHMEALMKWDGVEGFLESLGAYGEVIVASGEVIETL